jgi:phytoene/squalene synthetase
VVHAYATFDELVGYCRLSADPVGRLVLGIFAAASPQREKWSDAVCTGLQLAEHCQDVTEDAAAGRVYLPADDLARFGVDPAELTGPVARPQLRALLAFEAARARRFLDDGTPLVASLTGWARVAVAGFVAGGRVALDGLATAGFDPFSSPTHPSAARVVHHGVALLRGRSGGAG